MDGPQREDSLLKDLTWLRSLARRLVQDPDLAEDAVQDTLVTALTRRPARVESLRAWLAAVLRNVVRQEHRSRERRTVRETADQPAPEAPSTLEVVAELALHRRLVEAVHALSEPYRTTIVLRFLRSRTPREIAREQRVPVKTVHTRIERGLGKLRHALDQQFGGDGRSWAVALVKFAEDGPLPLALGLGSMVIPMNTKLVAAVGAVALVSGLAYLPFALRPEPLETIAVMEKRPTSVSQTTSGPQIDVAETLQNERQSVAVAASTMEEAEVVPDTGERIVHGSVCTMDGRNIPGIVVTFERKSDQTFVRTSEDARVTSAPDGTFEFPLPPHAGRLIVSSEEYASVVRPFLDRTVPAEPVLVVVAEKRTYAGRVVDPEGQGVADALVEISLDGDWLQASSLTGSGPAAPTIHLMLPFAETRTSSLGEFEIEDVGFVEGAYIAAQRTGFSEARGDLPEHSDRDVLLALGSLTSSERMVFGIVRDASGAPVESASVSMGQKSVTTSSAGTFSLTLETWQKRGLLRAVKRGQLPAAVHFDWDEHEAGGDPERPIELTLGGSPLAIRGRVVDAEGAPVSGALVWTNDTTYFGNVEREEGGRSILGMGTVETVMGGDYSGRGPDFGSIATVTEAQGAFALEGLLEHEYAIYVLDPRSLARATPALVASGADGLTLVLEPGEVRRVAGRVVSKGGVPLAEVRVALGRTIAWERPTPRPEDWWIGSPIRRPSATRIFTEGALETDENGQFEFEAIHVEDALLSLSGPKLVLGDSFQLDRTLALEELEIVVEAASRFRVQLADPGVADAFGFVDESGRIQPLFVEVEGHTISTPSVEIIGGLSGVVLATEGEHIFVFQKDGTETKRVQLTLEAGGVHAVRPW